MNKEIESINEQAAVLSDEDLAAVTGGMNVTENIDSNAPGETRKPMDPRAPKLPDKSRMSALA